jgi:hypothetical protein
MVFFVVGVTGFSAGLRLACALRGASSRLRYPASEKQFSGLFFFAASNPVD